MFARRLRINATTEGRWITSREDWKATRSTTKRKKTHSLNNSSGSNPYPITTIKSKDDLSFERHQTTSLCLPLVFWRYAFLIETRMGLLNLLFMLIVNIIFIYYGYHNWKVMSQTKIKHHVPLITLIKCSLRFSQSFKTIFFYEQRCNFNEWCTSMMLLLQFN